MTKLMEWLLFATLFLSLWLAAITGKITSSFITEWHSAIYYSPLYAALIFAASSMMIILYRVFTFNNCESAAKELQEVLFFLGGGGLSFDLNNNNCYIYFVFRKSNKQGQTYRVED